MSSSVVFQERIPKAVYQCQIESHNEAALGLAGAVLLNLGFKEDELTVSTSNGLAAIELFDEAPGRLRRIAGLFNRLNLKGIKLKQHRLAPKDWLTRWKLAWKPAALTKKIDVVPVWCRRQYKTRRGRDIILMDTLLSFGTGLHETTRLLAQIIEDRRGSFSSFFDIGTGTGILALVALKNGARDVTGIDIGELSVAAARDNMKVNQLHFRLQKADIHRFCSAKTFDFVAANLITGDLIEHASKIISFVKKGGLLGVSGISLDNLSKLRKAFLLLPLECLKVSKGKQWAALLYRKTM